jgi:hypothetical protein
MSRDYEGATVRFDVQLARTKAETARRNELWGRIERLPKWMRQIEALFWHLPWIGGGL